MYLYDIHTHQVKIEDAADYEVKCILNTYPESFHSKKQEYAGGWFSCGIHPWYAQDAAELDVLADIVKDDAVLAVGEVGLDKLQGPDMSAQIAVFRQQIELAVGVDKPLIIHCVKAWDELISLYKEYKTSIPWIIHGYRGNPDQTRQLIRLGFKLSVGEYFNPDSLREIPTDSIFCETDMSEISICHVYKA
ncbi:TatD family hydrolase, partial [Dysgonomonas sp. OttesenSCG-928-D17]|nr:TatD family hydrolase [Dysgonomonas sp. OttesenSCG-928-D17]